MNTEQKKYKFLTDEGQKILPKLLERIYLELKDDLDDKTSSFSSSELDRYLIVSFEEGKTARENILKSTETVASRLVFNKMMRSALTAAMFPNWLRSKHLNLQNPTDIFDKIFCQEEKCLDFNGVLPNGCRDKLRRVGREKFIEDMEKTFLTLFSGNNVQSQDKKNHKKRNKKRKGRKSKTLAYKFVRTGFDCMLFIEEGGGGKKIIRLIDSIYELQKTKEVIEPDFSVFLMHALPFLFQGVYGFGIPIAQNLLKDLGYSGFVKADTHIRKAVDAFKSNGLILELFDEENPCRIGDLFNEIKEVPGLFDKLSSELKPEGRSFYLDRLFWLYFGRNFYLHEKKGKVKDDILDKLIKTLKEEKGEGECPEFCVCPNFIA